MRVKAVPLAQMAEKALDEVKAAGADMSKATVMVTVEAPLDGERTAFSRILIDLRVLERINL